MKILSVEGNTQKLDGAHGRYAVVKEPDPYRDVTRRRHSRCSRSIQFAQTGNQQHDGQHYQYGACSVSSLGYGRAKVLCSRPRQ